MKRVQRLVLLLLLVAVPLRGLAATWAIACDAQDRTVAHASHECCDEAPGAAHGDAGHEDGQPGSHGTCSHCATCTAGAPALAGDGHCAAFEPAQGTRIPFLARVVPSGAAEPLDRPPLSL